MSSDICGGFTGAALGLLGPAGAFAGAFGAPVLSSFMKKVGTDILDRTISTREKHRIGAVFSYITVRINELIKQGKTIRSDGFFEQDVNSNSNADEVLEGILLAAQKEYEEKKLIYYSNMMADFAFDSFVNKSLANNLIKIAQQLSYTQLCLLKIFNNARNFKLRNSDYGEFAGKGMPYELINLLYEISDMIRLNLISRQGIIVFQLQDISPAEIHLFGMGQILYEKMLLKHIPENDIEPLVNILK